MNSISSSGQSKRVAIVGCGYVGRVFGERLAVRGVSVSGSVTRPEGCEALRTLGIEPAVLELSDRDALQRFLRDKNVVFMLVAPTGPQAAHRSVYLEGMRSLLEAAEGTAVRQILYTSSTSVYGQRDGSWVDESSPTQPASDNGQLLVQTERELLEGASHLGILATVLRLAGIIGPGRGPANRLATSAGTSRADGDALINLVHRDDIVEACLHLLDEPFSGVLNCSDGRPICRREYYDRLIQAAGLASIEWISPANPPDLGKRVSNRRIIERFGLSFRDATVESLQDVKNRRL